MKTKIYLQLLIVSLLTMMSCSKSALSDIELTDPSLVRVSVRIAQSESNDKEVQVFIRDKNDRTVELKNGSVEVNFSETRWGRSGIHNLEKRGYIYHLDEFEYNFHISIFLNSEDVYSFDINRSTGFYGFNEDYPFKKYDSGSTNYTYHDTDFNIQDMPFRNGRVKVTYHIL